MKPIESYKILEDVTGQIGANRETHDRIKESLRVYAELITRYEEKTQKSGKATNQASPKDIGIPLAREEAPA